MVKLTGMTMKPDWRWCAIFAVFLMGTHGKSFGASDALDWVPQGYRQADSVSMALWIPSPEDKSFAVLHAAEGMGIPLFVTRDIDSAVRQPMIFLAGDHAASEMTPRILSALSGYVAAGGILVTDNTQSPSLMGMAGVAQRKPSTSHFRISFRVESKDPGFAHLFAPESQTIAIGNPKTGETISSDTLVLEPGSGSEALAAYEDGTPALVMRQIGKGRVYIFGATFFDLVLLPQDRRDPDVSRHYDNHFEPSAEVPQWILRDWYLREVSGAFALDPIPNGKTGALIITHDIDYDKSIINMLQYAKAEHSLGLHATYFVQTKYITDYEDFAFFNARGRKAVRTVADLGGDIESHTVSHAYDWKNFPLGTGKETAATYRPRVLSRGKDNSHGKTAGGSVWGEIKVSKDLLEKTVPDHRVLAFRSGYLLINPVQWEILEQAGYRYDSSYTAGDVMTAVPYFVMERNGTRFESKIIEFPILIADTVSPLYSHVPQFVKLLDDEAAVHGVCVVLIHPNRVRGKWETELALFRHVKDKFWIGSLSQFGDFWRKRAQVSISTAVEGNSEIITLFSPENIGGLTLDFGDGSLIVIPRLPKETEEKIRVPRMFRVPVTRIDSLSQDAWSGGYKPDFDH